MTGSVVITGIGLVTALGRKPGVVLDRVRREDRAVRSPGFDVSAFDCKSYAPADDFHAEDHFSDSKTLRLMNRDAQMAVVAARSAMEDAGLRVEETYRGEDIALFGATGLTGLPTQEITRLARLSAAADGSLDLARFGTIALKHVRPVLSFKILANMPICFVSIFGKIRGENAVYTPWEGQGALAIAAGVRAVRERRASCALVGACDVKTHEFSFVSLQQLGVFSSWRLHGRGPIPSEGAAFLVLEDEDAAVARGARIYARVRGFGFGVIRSDRSLHDTLSGLLSDLAADSAPAVVSAAGGDVAVSEAEEQACCKAGIGMGTAVRPKSALGDLFAAAAPVQVALAAQLTRSQERRRFALANCFGHGSTQAAFLLEAP